jgi:hypothetical protein
MQFNKVDDHPVELGDVILSKWIGDTLEKHYPGWGWMVHVNSEQGMVEIQNVVLSTYTMGRPWSFGVPMSQLRYEDEIVRWAMRVGGEIIERMHQPRGSIEKAGLVEQVDGIKAEFNGLKMVADAAAAKGHDIVIVSG